MSRNDDGEKRKKKETEEYEKVVKEKGGRKENIRGEAAADTKSEIEQGLGVWVTL
ncbi:MAG TPA: hypothetical protein VGE97_06435 [Nitrososphaera sp.]|jgi:hypothetical protein